MPITNRLTERELQILEQISLGYNARQISKNLNISSSTVDTHRKNAMYKLQARNTPNLVRMAIETGVLKITEISY